jgi:predicted TIM-barrel enzyme
VRKASKLPVGIQVLAAANKEAIAIAQAADLQFIRAEGTCISYSYVSYDTIIDILRYSGYVFAHVADEGTMNSCAGEIMRYRKQIGADNVLVFTDIKKKHRYVSLSPRVIYSSGSGFK